MFQKCFSQVHSDYPVPMNGYSGCSVVLRCYADGVDQHIYAKFL